MNDYVIVTDSSCDLTSEMQEKLGVVSAQLFVSVDGEDSVMDRDVDKKALYAMLRGKKNITTSAASVGDFADLFDGILSGGRDLIYLGFSSALSSAYRSGENAAEMMREKYPERTILTVDTLCASLGQGLLVYLAAQKRDAGADIFALRDYVESTKLHICHWFTIDDLFFLKRGGRISSAEAVVGAMLGIKPVMHMDDNGKLVGVSKVRGRKAAVRAIIDKISELGIDVSEQTVFVSHGDCEDEANAIADTVRAELGVKDVIVGYVGPVIGSHAGPGTVSVFFVGTER